MHHDITDPLSLVGVFGTIATETASTFSPVREAYYLATDAQRYAWYADTTKHAPYNGGVEYHGRGFVQTTHKYNYQRIADLTGIDVVSQPDLLLEPQAASEALCIYWNDHGMSSIAQRQDWLGIRRAVYGGQDLDGAARIGRIANYLIPRLSE